MRMQKSEAKSRMQMRSGDQAVFLQAPSCPLWLMIFTSDFCILPCIYFSILPSAFANIVSCTHPRSLIISSTRAIPAW